jgi:hypothetical protein
MKLTFNINSSLLGFHVNGQKPMNQYGYSWYQIGALG